jgi:hypothetical protein
MPGGGGREAMLTADYNAEMIEQIARYPRVRDRAIFVGDPADTVPDSFGPGLPPIREWTEQHYDFAATSPASAPASWPAGRRSATATTSGHHNRTICTPTTEGRTQPTRPNIRQRIAGFPESPHAKSLRAGR